MQSGKVALTHQPSQSIPGKLPSRSNTIILDGYPVTPAFDTSVHVQIKTQPNLLNREDGLLPVMYVQWTVQGRWSLNLVYIGMFCHLATLEFFHFWPPVFWPRLFFWPPVFSVVPILCSVVLLCHSTDVESSQTVWNFWLVICVLASEYLQTLLDPRKRIRLEINCMSSPLIA